MSCLSLFLVAVIKHLSKATWRGKGFFALQVQVQTLKEAKEGRQDKSLGSGGTAAVIIKEHYLLACFYCCSACFLYSVEAPCPGLAPPILGLTSIINQHRPTDIHTCQSDEEYSSTEVPLLR